MATPLQVGKSLEKAALEFSMLRFSYWMMKTRVPISTKVAPTPSPNKK